MKKTIKVLCLSLLLFALIASRCKKDFLTAETQIGANTFGYKINGKVWVTKGSDGYSGRNIFGDVY